MQLEHILQAHGLLGRGGKGETPLPELVNFTAISKNDGTGIDLNWQNSDVIEYVRTEIYASTENIQNTNYEYCVENASLIANSDTATSMTVEGFSVGTTVYFKGFMIFNILGEIKNNKGIGLSCTISDTVPPGAITNFTATGDDGQVMLTWVNPVDVDFDKVKILYKQSIYPTSPTDGMVGYEGSGTATTVTGLTNDTEYYFRAFTYDSSGNVNDSIENQQLTATPSDVDDKSGSPGSPNLIAGTMQQGYFGTVPASELWTGSQLASAVGISQGTVQFDDINWLKFALDGKILFRPQKAFRHSISWDTINTAGCVFGTKTVAKNGITYKVRLMKGALTDPSMYTDSDRGAKGSEWNKLMLPIHIQAKDKNWGYPAYVEDDIPYWGIDFTDEDLHTHNTYGDGTYVWCQETRNDNASSRVVRGYSGVSYSSAITSSSTAASRGWTPVLELVP